MSASISSGMTGTPPAAATPPGRCSALSRASPLCKSRSRTKALAQLVVLALVAILLTCAVANSDVLAQQTAPDKSNPASLRPINIGFLRHAVGPWMARIADGGIDSTTGRTIRWFPHDTDSSIVVDISSGRLDIGLIGAAVAAAAIVRGLDLRIFYVLGGSPDSDGLVVGPSIDQGDARSLAAKVIAVPFGSTPHFRLLESLKHLGATLPSLRVVNLQTSQIRDAWRRGEVDAAAGSDPLLTELSARGHRMPLANSGPHSGLLVLAAQADFATQHSVFLSRYIDIIARAEKVRASRDRPYTTDDPDIKAIAQATGLLPDAIASTIARVQPPPLAEQLSNKWLGGGIESGLVAHLKSTVDIWRWAGRLPAREPDFIAAITLVPAQMALGYQK